MRVYEFAKKKKLSSKDVLAQLEKEGIKLASHMSVLTDEALQVLEKKPKEKTVLERKVAPEKKVAKPKIAVEQKKEAPKKIIKAVKKKPVVRPKPFIKRHAPKVPVNITEITVDKEMPLFVAAQLMGKPEGEVILALLRKGMVCNRNHLLGVEVISDLAHHFGIKVIVSSKKEEFVESRLAVEEVTAKGKKTRWPIVVVMGHVDHGKTTLLDYIRKMNTAAKERGGITQHLSAYEVDSVHGKVIFLDTPGHEAFSYMRKRGTSVTDMVVLIIAADDGVMPQTVEVINHAKSADVPIIVAINKVDKVDRDSSIERVKRQLAQHDLLPEDWGGQIICVPISAKSGEGVEELLEMITLQSQMMELKADPKAAARGFILESKQEKGFGPVATVICLNGTIKIGDHFVCGSSVGKVRLLINSLGKRVLSAGPSIPVQVIGFDNFVSLGDWLTVVSPQDYLKEKALRKKDSAVSSSGISPSLGADKAKTQGIPLIIKTDTHGSREAILGAIKKINKTHPDIPFNFQIIYSGIGDIIERDVDLAAHSGALIMALHVKMEKNATALAREQVVEVKEFGIIYQMTEFLEELLKEHEPKITIRKKVGEAVVRKVFDLGKRGVIAGCYVSDGLVPKDGVVVCIRNNDEIGEGKIVSLQRERKNVKEVHSGHECGFITDSFHGWQVEDAVHIFLEEKKKRSEI